MLNNNTSFSWDRFFDTPVVGILRGIPISQVMQIAEKYLKAGFSSLEITANTAGAYEIIETLRKDFPELNVGAGTVCNMKDWRQVVDAGSQFIVTPVVDVEVIKQSVKNEMPIFPGAFSPTEIYLAWSLGASAVKVYPATQLGSQYIKDVLAPLDRIKLLPTGGISLANVKSFFEAGAMGVGMGSGLFDKSMISAENWGQLQQHFEQVKDEVEEVLSIS